MRYKIRCKSILLQKALEEFLKDYLFEDGKVISDEEGDIVIGKDIKKPFTKSSLLIQLENLKNRKLVVDFNKLASENDKIIVNKSIVNRLSFEEKLDKLINEFAKNLKNLIKEEYGKK